MSSERNTIEIIKNFDLFTLFLLGSIIMRSAGCIINDMWDRKIDSKVERTKLRPLASGELSLKQAIINLLILLFVGLIILLNLNRLTIVIGFCFMLPVIIYPLMKRFMSIPQIFLAITFNAGALMGWSATQNSLDLSAWILYGAAFFWTIGYDTIYAHQDKKDDKKIGVKSSALTFGKYGKIYLCLCYSLMILLIAYAGFINNYKLLFYFIISAIFALSIHQIISVNLDDTKDCMKKFRLNGQFGLLIFIAILLGNNSSI